ncbi:MAG: AbrB/MazE/SpoVT family DNA-binding domain-containing protein [Desulfurococcus sp.]|nr:AbrB/MazE/SpoVT family DNA-binding domain-containing protein [Desulfurococcus sp.]
MIESKEYIVRVSRKGQIVIPVEVRRAFGIKDRVAVRVEDGEIKIIPVKPMEELFGVDGEAMKRVALEVSEERLREIENE